MISMQYKLTNSRTRIGSSVACSHRVLQIKVLYLSPDMRNQYQARCDVNLILVLERRLLRFWNVRLMQREWVEVLFKIRKILRETGTLTQPTWLTKREANRPL